MGWIFEKNDVPIWEPSLNVGRLFLASVRALEQQVGRTSGLSESMSDTIEIDEAQLTEFTRALLRSINFSHPSLFLLVHAPVVHLVALLRAVSPSVELQGIPDDWSAEAGVLAAMWGKI